MQLCDMNLNDYIRNPCPQHLTGKSRFFSTNNPYVPVEWAILSDIASGLAFIHSLGEVHRDLKPRNGVSLAHIRKLIRHSALFVRG